MWYIVTDGRVVCAETVMNPLQMYITEQSFNATDDDDEQLKFLLTLRYTESIFTAVFAFE